jgi:cell division protein FtsI/penicillin-binding protein 2
MPARGGSPRRAGSSPARRRKEPSRLRVLCPLVIALLLTGTVWVKLAYWQVIQHASMVEWADALHVASVTLPASRGVIYDDQGRPLALNTTVYDISLSPQMVDANRREQVANGLSAVLGVKADDLLAVMKSKRKFWSVVNRVPKDKADQLHRMNLPGVLATPVPQRTYLQGGVPDTTLASQVLGFVDYGGHGQRGVEEYYQRQLGGRDGQAALDRDSSGVPIVSTTHNRRDPLNGSDLTLSIDSDAQYLAEQAIAEGVQANHAQSGSVLIMDSRSGGIVASASYPGYSANDFAHTPPARTQDPIVSSLYEPGSIMKVVTLAGAIDAGAITPDTVISDPGYVTVGGWTIRDWDRRAHGQVTMTNVLENSLNVGAVHAEQMEGGANLLKYLRAFGFGRPTDAGVAGEANRGLQPAGQWSDITLATGSFGQGVAVNMVQMLAAVNVIAAGGVYVQPHVVQKVGGIPVQPRQWRVVKPETAVKMNTMMRSVVQHGSGYKARINGFELDETGKTGTSQQPENGHYSDTHVWASYVGFLPAQNPRFTMLVMVNQPNNGSWDANDGYTVSAPIWKRIAEQLVLQQQIAPEQLPPTPS